jgi:hypothetical protein
MDNNELINKRVHIVQDHIQQIFDVLDEIELLTPKISYLDDLVRDASSQLAMVKYRLDVMNSITERIEA